MSKTPKLLDQLIEQAIKLKASDIHFEPKENQLNIRYRVDGLLGNETVLDKSLHPTLISRLKILVNLNIAESRLPQDGRTSFNNLDLRVSTISTLHGEKAVVRLLDRQQSNLQLEQLGLEKEDLQLYQKMLAQKHGLILVTGPTGSGKTTTLYATLARLKAKSLNITTIEDPVEYQLPEINQVQVQPKIGLTFARGLRSILRQDPDIIMVGEIRDLETAKISLQAALTGHLVLATLHTNDAASAINRLVDMGLEKYLVQACLLCVVAQRLVRKLSPNGYSGRIGVYEILPGKGKVVPERSLINNGWRKVEQKLTSQEELGRVLALE